MFNMRPTWSRVGGVLISVALATMAVSPLPAYAASSEQVDKVETVHVSLDASGGISSLTVEDLLANSGKESRLSDRTTLQDVSSKDDEVTFTQDAQGLLTWDARGEEVSYEGTTSQEPPVKVSVSYTLDGRPVDPTDLAGAQGHLVMRFDYANSLSQTRTIGDKQETIYTPFVCMTVAFLDTDVFSNVQVTGGKLIDDKGASAVIGYALPGLRESLDVNPDDIDIDFPESLQIEADVTDFRLDPVYTIVTPELLSDLDTSSLDFDDFGEGSDELRDAMSQLIDGSDALTGALEQLSSGSSQLSGGISALKEKLGMLPTGIAAFASGAQALATGLDGATTAAGQLAEGASTLPGMATAAQDALSGTHSAVDTAADKVNEATQSVSQLQEGVNSLNVDATKVAASEAKDAAGAVSEAATAVQAAASELKPTITGTDAVAESLDAAEAALAAHTATVALDDIEGLTDEQKAAIMERVETLTAEQQNVVANAQTAIDEAQAKLTEVTASAEPLDLSNLDAALDTFGGKADALDKATVDVSSIADGARNAKSALDEASGALAQTGVGFDGAARAITGIEQAAGGLSAGVSGLAGSLGGARDGAQELATKLGALSDSTPQLMSGLDALEQGANQLSGGLAATAEGSGQLTSGLTTFDDEGISKIVDTFDDLDNDITGMTDRLDALRDAAKEYDTFAGKADGQTGSVRFVFKTAQIG